MNVYTVFKGIVAEIRAPFPDENCRFYRAGERIYSEGVVSTIEQWTNVTFSKVIGFDGLENGVFEVLLRFLLLAHHRIRGG